MLRQNSEVKRASSLLTMVAKELNLVLVPDYFHRKNQLYTRKGHAHLIKFQSQPKCTLSESNQ